MSPKTPVSSVLRDIAEERAAKEEAAARAWASVRRDVERTTRSVIVKKAELATLIRQYGVRPGTWEAHYVADRLLGNRTRRGNDGHARRRRKWGRDADLRVEYDKLLAEYQKLRKDDPTEYRRIKFKGGSPAEPPSVKAKQMLAQKYNVSFSVIKHAISEPRR